MNFQWSQPRDSFNPMPLTLSHVIDLWECGMLGNDPRPPDPWRPWVQLVEPLTGISSVGGPFTVPAGFVYDQASVPRAATWLVNPAGPHIRRAACLHDYRCPWKGDRPKPANGEILSSNRAADEMFDGMIADGAAWWRANLCRWAVRNYGPRF